MLESLRMLLELRGYKVRTYLRALDLLDEIDGIRADDTVVTDYYLPDMNGVDLLKRIRFERPRVRALLLTGSREIGVVKSARAALSDCTVLYKPVDLEALEKGLRSNTV
jgi:DNA-binding NtrC family response regulator